MKYFVVFYIIIILLVACKPSTTHREEEDIDIVIVGINEDYKEITWKDIVLDTLRVYSHEGLIEDSIIADRKRLLGK